MAVDFGSERPPRMTRPKLLLSTMPLLLLGCSKGSPGVAADGRREIAITVDAVGYHPAESHAKAGEPVRLVVTRTTEDGCGQELVIPSLNLKRELPLRQPVTIDVTMPAKGAIAFACGMDMMHGSIVAD
jgi:plastocyanin domain-containing protein